MHIRDLRRDDGALLIDFHARLSPASRYQRFHGAVPTLNKSMLTVLLDVDGWDHIALVAFADQGAVGIARLIRHPGRRHEAEVAVAVADAWHRRGVGRQLVQALIQRADSLGISQVSAGILAGNTPALSLFRAMFPLCVIRRGDGIIDLEGLLVYNDQTQITMDEILADLLS